MTVYEEIKLGLEQAIEHAQGNLIAEINKRSSNSDCNEIASCAQKE